MTKSFHCGTWKAAWGVRAVCALVFALLAGTVLARVAVATSEKSYFIDTRQPIVALSDSARLTTFSGGVFIFVR